MATGLGTMRLESENRIAPLANGVMWLTMLCAVLLLAAAGLVVAYQCFAWLRTGEWPPFELGGLGEHFGWKAPTVESGVFQEIFYGFLTWPLSIILLCIGVALGYLGFTIGMIFDTRRNRRPPSVR